MIPAPMIADQSARVEVLLSDGTLHVGTPDASGTAHCGPIDVEYTSLLSGFQAVIANVGQRDERLDSISFCFDLGPVGRYPRLFSNGYQSWSPTGARFIGIDQDASRHPRSPNFVQFVHNADPSRMPARTLRSEQVCAIDLDTGAPRIVAGFDGGAEHAGTFRVHITTDNRLELAAVAWWGGATLRRDTRRELHEVTFETGDDVDTMLGHWADRVGRNEHARVDSPFRAGWCSWYHYFHDVTEQAVLHNLERSRDWPFEVFQVDDGFQSEIGDWLVTNDKFDSDLGTLAEAISATGRTPGLWLAPFLASDNSRILRDHRDWFANHREHPSEPVISMIHEHWGGFMRQLDTTNPEVQAHLETLAATLRAMGYSYLKLDFTFSPGADGIYHDPTATPAQRVRAGYEAIRRGAGDDAFILGCGAPLGAVVGVVDAMRIGPDVAPSWEVLPRDNPIPGYHDAAPGTRHAWNSTLLRSFMHRRLWLNDPDCLMLRQQETALTEEQARAWTLAVGMSGGLAIVSDDLALLDASARRQLDAAIELGRAADAEAATGRTPACPDHLAPGGPRTLETTTRRLHADPADPHPVLEQL